MGQCLIQLFVSKLFPNEIISEVDLLDYKLRFWLCLRFQYVPVEVLDVRLFGL